MRTSLTGRALTLAACLLGPALPIGAQTIVPLVVEGDVVVGVGAVTRIDNLAINDLGEWIVEVDTDHANADADGALIRGGALWVREGDPLGAPAGAPVGSFDSIILTTAGEVSQNLFLDGTAGSFDDSGVYYNAALVIQESAVSTAAGFTAGTPYIGFFETRLNDANQILIVASVDDPAIPSTVDRGLVIAQVTSAGALVSETLLYKEGDALPGQTDTVVDFETGAHEIALNDAGQVLFGAQITGDPARDHVIYVDGTLIAQEGDPSPVVGRSWSSLSSPELDLEEHGDYAFSGSLDGDPASNLLIVRAGQKLIQEGDSLPGMSGYAFTSFGSGPIDIADTGDVLWYGDWDDPNLDVDTGLFLNHTLVVQEGVTQVGGVLIDTLRGVQDGYALSDNGLYMVFEAILQDGREGVFLIEIGEPTVYCTAKINSQMCLPLIGYTGKPSSSSATPFRVNATNVLNNKNGILFYGYQPLSLPFQGGWLCVAPPIRRTPPQNSGGHPPPHDCSGVYDFDFNALILSGQDPLLTEGQLVYSQYWTRDPSSPSTTGLTDALRFAITP